MDPSTRKLDGLEALRGIAALIVVLHHGFGWVSLPQNFDAKLLWGFFLEGNLGVNIFFVLSGFVITWSNPRDHCSARTTLIYILRRVARIFPLYWLANLLVVPIYWKFAPAAIGGLSWERAVHDIFLLPYHRTPMLGPAWTLVFEMMFYMLFVPMLWNRKAALAMFTIMTGVIVVSGVQGFSPSNPWLAHLTSPYVLQFLAGMVVCFLVKKYPIGPRTAAIAVWTGALAILFIAVGECITGTDWVSANLHYAACAAVLVFGIVSLPEPSNGHSRAFLILQVFGRYSFSIYLFHVPVEQTVTKVAVKIFGSHPGEPIVWMVVLISVTLALSAGMFMGKFAELPMLEWCKTRISKLKPRRSPEAAPAPQM